MNENPESFSRVYRDVSDQKRHLILGNGFSLGASKKFDYKSLYDKAPLSTRIREVFKEKETPNFEEILDFYNKAIELNLFYQHPCPELTRDRNAVRQALVAAISAIHPTQSEINGDGVALSV